MNYHTERYHWKEERNRQKCLWATVEIKTLYRDLKARILNLIYSWDPIKRPRGVATRSHDSDILAHLEEQTSESLISHLPERREKVMSLTMLAVRGTERASGAALEIQFWRQRV